MSYADRFFSPPEDAPRTGPSTSRTAPPDVRGIAAEGAASDLLDGGPDTGRVPDTPAWWARWHIAVSVVVAFAVGIGFGAYAWDRHQVSANLAASRAKVDVVPAITYINRFRGRIELGVSFTNRGEYTVTAGPPSFVDSALVADPGAGVPQKIEPDGTALRTVTAAITCPSENTTGDWAPDLDLAATITTPDGVARRTTFPIDEQSISFASDLGRICGAIALTMSDVYFYVTTVGSTPEGHVTSQLVVADAFEVGRFDPSSARAAQLYLDTVEVGAGTGAYTVTTTPRLPAVVFPGAQLSVRWDVADCTQAARATADDMMLTFGGHINDGEPGFARLQGASVDLATSLVRMTFELCGAGAADG